MAATRFLTDSRRSWLAKFFSQATIVLLAGVVGGDLFFKLSPPWRAVLMIGGIAAFCLGLLFTTSTEPGD